MDNTAGRIVLDVSTSLGFRFSPPNKYTRVERALLDELQHGKDAAVACCGKSSTFVLADEVYAQGGRLRVRRAQPMFDSLIRRLSLFGSGRRFHRRQFDRSFAFTAPFTFEARDLVLLAGASWNHLDLVNLRRLKEKIGFTLAGFVYDLLPIQYPSFISSEGRKRYRDFLFGLAEVVDLVVTPSDAVAADIQNFLREHQKKMPRIATVSLAAAALSTGEGASSRRLKSDHLHKKSFALCVAPLRKREHLLWLYSLWSELWEREKDQPILVCAGEILEPDLLDLLCHDPLWGKAAIFYANPSDAELHWLYSRSLFCLHPSFEGGLGLPVREALNHGKPCISADAVSLSQMHEALSIHLPQDRAAWLAEIRKLSLAVRADRCDPHDLDPPASILGQILDQLPVVHDISKIPEQEIASRSDIQAGKDGTAAAALTPHVRRRR